MCDNTVREVLFNRTLDEISFGYCEAEALLRRKRETLVKPGTRLDRRFLEWCGKSEFSAAEISSLFEKASDRPASRYTCDVRCPVCQAWRIEVLGISSVRELIRIARKIEPDKFDTKLWCAQCEEAARLRRETERNSYSNEDFIARIRAEAAQKRPERAATIVSEFLSPAHRWHEAVPQQKRFEVLTKEPFDEEVVAAKVRALSWSDFFKTPYWSAVHDEALRRVRERCVVCGRSEPLRLHYRTHDRHGFEHTDAGMRELLLLCKHCELTSPLQTKLDSN